MHNNRSFLIIILLCSIFSPLYANTFDQEMVFDRIPEQGFFDFIGDPFLFDDAEYDLLASDTTDQYRTVDPDVIVPILISQADILQILQENLYLHTNQFNKRSLLDRTVFEDFVRVYLCDCYFAGGQIFASMINRNNFTKKSTDMDSYIALQEPSLIEKLENVVKKLQPLFANPNENIDIQRLLGLFKTMTVQERSGGVMLFGGRYWDDKRLIVQIPVYYLERNFSLTDEERVLVEAEFGRMDPEEQEKFQQKHLISDKVGLGDTRIQFDACIAERDFSYLYGGLFTTLPTALCIEKGIKGSGFPKPCNFPTFSFTQLFDLALNPTPANQQEAFDIINTFLLGAIDRLAANLLDTPLGNGGHIGLGGYLTLDIPFSRWIEQAWAEDTIFENRMTLELFLPKKEKRFFINKINPKDFDPANFVNPSDPIIDPVEAAKNLAFLESQFVQRLYLRAFSVTIFPRPVFRYISKVSYLGDPLIATVGMDWWLQGVDGINHIRDKKIQSQVCFPKVFPPIAYQLGVFGSITYKSNPTEDAWLYTLSGDGILFKRGIGKFWGIALGIERLF